MGEHCHQASTGYAGQRDVHEVADGEHPLRGHRLRELGHHIRCDPVDRDSGGRGRLDKPGVPLRGLGGGEHLVHHARRGQRFPHGLRAFGQEALLALPERALGEPTSPFDAGRSDARELVARHRAVDSADLVRLTPARGW